MSQPHGSQLILQTTQSELMDQVLPTLLGGKERRLLEDALNQSFLTSQIEPTTLTNLMLTEMVLNQPHTTTILKTTTLPPTMIPQPTPQLQVTDLLEMPSLLLNYKSNLTTIKLTLVKPPMLLKALSMEDIPNRLPLLLEEETVLTTSSTWKL